MDNDTMVAVTPEDYALAETVVHASNIVSHDGYYEVDIDRAATAIARHRHQSGRTGAGEALREALLAIRQSIEDAAYACKPCRADCGPVQACNVSMEIIDAALSQSTAGEDVT